MKCKTLFAVSVLAMMLSCGQASRFNYFSHTSKTSDPSITPVLPLKSLDPESEGQKPIDISNFSIFALGNATGNGGHVLVCGDETAPTSVQILDYWEAQNRWQLTVELGDASWTPEQKVAYALSRLERLDAGRAALLKRWSEEFWTNARVLDGRLPFIDDLGDSVPTPSGCVLKQLARQTTPNLPEDPRFVIDHLYWDGLDNTQKAGLILHEIFYAEAIFRGHSDSRFARYWNALVSSDKFASLTQDDYEDRRKKSRFDAFWAGERFEQSTVTFYYRDDLQLSFE